MAIAIDLSAPPPLLGLVCRANAAEARQFALATDGPTERAIWLDVAALWDLVAATGLPRLREIAQRRTADAFARLL